MPPTIKTANVLNVITVPEVLAGTWKLCGLPGLLSMCLCVYMWNVCKTGAVSLTYKKNTSQPNVRFNDIRFSALKNKYCFYFVLRFSKYPANIMSMQLPFAVDDVSWFALSCNPNPSFVESMNTLFLFLLLFFFHAILQKFQTLWTFKNSLLSTALLFEKT